nr:unnamed protein product [Digitaria exilis]
MQAEDYSSEMSEMEGVSREEYLASLRRRSSGFSRGVSKYRGDPDCSLRAFSSSPFPRSAERCLSLPSHLARSVLSLLALILLSPRDAAALHTPAPRYSPPPPSARPPPTPHAAFLSTTKPPPLSYTAATLSVPRRHLVCVVRRRQSSPCLPHAGDPPPQVLDEYLCSDAPPLFLPFLLSSGTDRSMAADRQQGAMDGDRGCEQRRGQRCEAGAMERGDEGGARRRRGDEGGARECNTAEAGNLGIDSVAGGKRWE